ncbi:hypothetical protein [Marinobacter salsuginis]|jgi:hypothetical protein|uniref:Uncharacterized protein n=1 Tax=Marinobacter salsuginis TaxID=418719 RepID=A0A5M3Q173_9GAMM|nr:hypothetical protein [Marinobacter salsuginis]GBO88739.1 hypothetical protein MSSD14B_24070 [Marinobacter salsuginis]
MTQVIDERVLKIYRDRIAFVQNSNVTVSVDRSLPTVSIDPEDGEGFFMQESEAQTFLDEADRVYEELQEVSFDEACMAVASPYVDLMA